MILLIFIILANSWIWKIKNSYFFLFIILILATLILYFGTEKKSYLPWLGSLVLLIILAIFQWKTTTWQSLVLLDNDEQRIQKMRLEFYRPSLHYTRVIFSRLDLKNFLEGNFNTVTNRIQRNFF